VAGSLRGVDRLEEKFQQRMGELRGQAGA